MLLAIMRSCGKVADGAKMHWELYFPDHPDKEPVVVNAIQFAEALFAACAMGLAGPAGFSPVSASPLR
jgi:hypothetical protein